ncbi:MAG TPA: HD domain-containing phosphohydrolase [Nitrospirota bacterium]
MGAGPRGPAGLGDLFNIKAISLGKALVNQIAILLKVAQMHSLQNVAVENAANSLKATLDELLEAQKSFSLYLIGDYFYLEDNRVKYGVEDFANFEFLAGEFKSRRLGAVSFNASVEPSELIAFVSVFLGTDLGAKDVYQDMARRLAGAGLSGVAAEEFKAVTEVQDFESTIDTAKAAKRAYIRLVLRVRELMDGIANGLPADTRKLKRAVQAVVDSAYKNEPVLVRLSAIRRGEDVLSRHYANVCVLSLGVGKRLGLSKFQMARLGMAAALHDIGRTGMPEGTLERVLDMDEEATAVLMDHPRNGVETLLRLKGLNESAVSAMIVAYEHHRNVDGSGYPEQVEPKEQNIFSRVVRVADNYDATTSSGIYGRFPVSPDKALALMLRRSGTYYDPEPLSAFARMMGAYPVGSLLLLSDGAIGVVSEPGDGEEGYARPRVTLLPGAGGIDGGQVDLSEKDEAGRYLRDAVSTLSPMKANVNIYRYLV